MRALWHLTTKTLAGRPGRSLLLVLAVALATVLTVAAAAAVGTISRTVGHIAGRVAGRADVSVQQRFGAQMPQSLLEDVRTWPDVELACGRIQGTAALRHKDTDRQVAALLRGVPQVTVVLRGIEPEGDAYLAPRQFVAGRTVRRPGEVMICSILRDELKTDVGDVLQVVRPGRTAELTVVGVFDRPDLAVGQRPTAITPLAQAQRLVDQPDRVDEILIKLRPGVDVGAWDTAHASRLPPGAVFRTSASVRAGITRYLRFAELMLYVLSVLAALSSGFLILTSLTTTVMQQTRELAIFRCLGAGRSLLAGAQLSAGTLIALGGAAVGAPLGLLIAYTLFSRYRDALPGGFAVNPAGMVMAVSFSVLAGLLGAAYPAFLAATARPLEALALRAKRPRNRHVILCGVSALVLMAAQPIVMLLPISGDAVVWFWTRFGLPALFVGCFLLGVPLLVLIVRCAAPALSRLLGLPRSLLAQSLLATPIRQGFTGGTLMIGLGLLVAFMTMGRSISAGWLWSIKMPDAFVTRLPSFTDEQCLAVRNTPAATGVCPTAIFPVKVEGMQFGLKEVAPPNTLFVATDTEAFVRMTDLDWYEGDAETALRRLAAGRALVVTREWAVAHDVGVGTTQAVKTIKGPVDFQVVGVIGSPGLDVAKRFFGMRRTVTGLAISSVFGTLADAKRHFGVNAATILLVSLHDGVDDDEAVRQLTAAAPGSLAGTSRQIRLHVRERFGRMMVVAGALAIGSLILACLCVGNLVVGEVTSRRFEFGVLRAVGCPRGLLGRLVAGQTLVIALVGCAAGTILGLEFSLIERGLHMRLIGIEYALHLPWDTIAWGTSAVAGAALVAALPAIWWLIRRTPRALLARRE